MLIHSLNLEAIADLAEQFIRIGIDIQNRWFRIQKFPRQYRNIYILEGILTRLFCPPSKP